MATDAAFWNGLADEYSRKPVDDPSAFDRKIAITRERLSPGDTVLNVGCGTGSLSLRLADTGADLHGVDISEEMIRIARAKATDAGVDNATFHVAPFHRFDTFAEGRLDALLAFSIVHLVDDIPATLSRMFRLLRPGGHFVSSTVCLGASWFPYRPMLRVMHWLGRAPRVVQILTPEQLMQQLRDAGFVEVTLHDVGAKPDIAFVTARTPPARDGE